MACDEDAFKTFSDIFGPVISDLHPKFDFRYSYKSEPINLDALQRDIDALKWNTMSKLDNVQMSLRRNFRSMPFTPMMTKESKMQVERRVVEVLGELYGTYRSMLKLEDQERDWLLSIGIPITKTPLHDAAGINDDWPAGRGIFIDDNHEFIVLVNFEDHIRIIMLPGQEIKKEHPNREGPEFKSSIKRLEKLNAAFERIGYAQDPYLGNLTVAPQYLGTGMTISAEYRMEG